MNAYDSVFTVSPDPQLPRLFEDAKIVFSDASEEWRSEFKLKSTDSKKEISVSETATFVVPETGIYPLVRVAVEALGSFYFDELRKKVTDRISPASLGAFCFLDFRGLPIPIEKEKGMLCSEHFPNSPAGCPANWPEPLTRRIPGLEGTTMGPKSPKFCPIIKIRFEDPDAWTKALMCNAPDHYGRTLLHWACVRNSPKAVRVLIAKGASMTAVDGRGQTPLHVAAEVGSVECVRELLAAETALLQRTRQEWEEAEKKRIQQAKKDKSVNLSELSMGPPPEVTLASQFIDGQQRSAAHVALYHRSLVIAVMLIAHGVPVNRPDSLKNTVEFLLVKSRNFEASDIVKAKSREALIKMGVDSILQKSGVDVEKQLKKSFANVCSLGASSRGHATDPLVEVVCYLDTLLELQILRPSDLCYLDVVGRCFVFDCIDNNNMAMFKYILAVLNKLSAHKGGSRSFWDLNQDLAFFVSFRDSRRQNPLHHAAARGLVPFVKLFAETAPELIYEVDCQNKTPLHVALEFGRREAAEALLSCGPDLSIFDDNGNTPLHLAAVQGFTSALSRMLKKRSDLVSARIWPALEAATPRSLSFLTGRDHFRLKKLDKNVKIYNQQNLSAIDPFLPRIEKYTKNFVEQMLCGAIKVHLPTPLACAVLSRDLSTVQVVLAASKKEAPVLLQEASIFGDHPISFCFRNNLWDIAAALMKHAHATNSPTFDDRVEKALCKLPSASLPVPNRSPGKGKNERAGSPSILPEHSESAKRTGTAFLKFLKTKVSGMKLSMVFDPKSVLLTATLDGNIELVNYLLGQPDFSTQSLTADYSLDRLKLATPSSADALSTLFGHSSMQSWRTLVTDANLVDLVCDLTSSNSISCASVVLQQIPKGSPALSARIMAIAASFSFSDHKLLPMAQAIDKWASTLLEKEPRLLSLHSSLFSEILRRFHAATMLDFFSKENITPKFVGRILRPLCVLGKWDKLLQLLQWTCPRHVHESTRSKDQGDEENSVAEVDPSHLYKADISYALKNAVLHFDGSDACKNVIAFCLNAGISLKFSSLHNLGVKDLPLVHHMVLPRAANTHFPNAEIFQADPTRSYQSVKSGNSLSIRLPQAHVDFYTKLVSVLTNPQDTGADPNARGAPYHLREASADTQDAQRNSDLISEPPVFSFHVACAHGHTELVSLALKHDPSLATLLTNDGNRSPLFFASMCGDGAATVDILAANGAKFENDEAAWDAFVSITRMDNLSVLSSLLKHKLVPSTVLPDRQRVKVLGSTISLDSASPFALILARGSAAAASLFMDHSAFSLNDELSCLGSQGTLSYLHLALLRIQPQSKSDPWIQIVLKLLKLATSRDLSKPCLNEEHNALSLAARKAQLSVVSAMLDLLGEGNLREVVSFCGQKRKRTVVHWACANSLFDVLPRFARIAPEQFFIQDSKHQSPFTIFFHLHRDKLSIFETTLQSCAHAADTPTLFDVLVDAVKWGAVSQAQAVLGLLNTAKGFQELLSTKISELTAAVLKSKLSATALDVVMPLYENAGVDFKESHENFADLVFSFALTGADDAMCRLLDMCPQTLINHRSNPGGLTVWMALRKCPKAAIKLIGQYLKYKQGVSGCLDFSSVDLAATDESKMNAWAHANFIGVPQIGYALTAFCGVPEMNIDIFNKQFPPVQLRKYEYASDSDEDDDDDSEEEEESPPEREGLLRELHYFDNEAKWELEKHRARRIGWGSRHMGSRPRTLSTEDMGLRIVPHPMIISVPVNSDQPDSPAFTFDYWPFASVFHLISTLSFGAACRYLSKVYKPYMMKARQELVAQCTDQEVNIERRFCPLPMESLWHVMRVLAKRDDPNITREIFDFLLWCDSTQPEGLADLKREVVSRAVRRQNEHLVISVMQHGGTISYSQLRFAAFIGLHRVLEETLKRSLQFRKGQLSYDPVTDLDASLYLEDPSSNIWSLQVIGDLTEYAICGRRIECLKVLANVYPHLAGPVAILNIAKQIGQRDGLIAPMMDSCRLLLPHTWEEGEEDPLYESVMLTSSFQGQLARPRLSSVQLDLPDWASALHNITPRDLGIERTPEWESLTEGLSLAKMPSDCDDPNPANALLQYVKICLKSIYADHVRLPPLIHKMSGREIRQTVLEKLGGCDPEFVTELTNPTSELSEWTKSNPTPLSIFQYFTYFVLMTPRIIRMRYNLAMCLVLMVKEPLAWDFATNSFTQVSSDLEVKKVGEDAVPYFTTAHHYIGAYEWQQVDTVIKQWAMQNSITQTEQKLAKMQTTLQTLMNVVTSPKHMSLPVLIPSAPTSKNDLPAFTSAELETNLAAMAKERMLHAFDILEKGTQLSTAPKQNRDPSGSGDSTTTPPESESLPQLVTVSFDLSQLNALPDLRAHEYKSYLPKMLAVYKDLFLPFYLLCSKSEICRQAFLSRVKELVLVPTPAALDARFVYDHANKRIMYYVPKVPCPQPIPLHKVGRRGTWRAVKRSFLGRGYIPNIPIQVRKPSLTIVKTRLEEILSTQKVSEMCAQVAKLQSKLEQAKNKLEQLHSRFFPQVANTILQQELKVMSLHKKATVQHIELLTMLEKSYKYVRELFEIQSFASAVQEMGFVSWLSWSAESISTALGMSDLFVPSTMTVGLEQRPWHEFMELSAAPEISEVIHTFKSKILSELYSDLEVGKADENKAAANMAGQEDQGTDCDPVTATKERDDLTSTHGSSDVQQLAQQIQTFIEFVEHTRPEERGSRSMLDSAKHSLEDNLAEIFRMAKWNKNEEALDTVLEKLPPLSVRTAQLLQSVEAPPAAGDALLITTFLQSAPLFSLPPVEKKALSQALGLLARKLAAPKAAPQMDSVMLSSATAAACIVATVSLGLDAPQTSEHTIFLPVLISSINSLCNNDLDLLDRETKDRLFESCKLAKIV